MLIFRHRLMGCPSHLGSLTIRFAAVDSPSFPGSSPLATTMTNFQVSLNLRSVAVRRFHQLGSPRISVPRLTRIYFPGLPRFRIYG